MKDLSCIILFLLVALLLAACSSDEEPKDLFPLSVDSVDLPEFDGFTFNVDEIHPKQENIPHADVIPIPLTPAALTEAENLPKQLKLLHRFLNEPESITEVTDLDFFTSDNIRFHAESLNDSTLILSDDRSNELHHYHLNRNEAEKFAPEGRGPGDILLNREVQLVDKTLYVAMEGGRISLFECSNVPCEHIKEINTDYNHYSVVPSGENLVALGIPPYMGPDHDHEVPRHPLHVINRDGETLHSFSYVYRDDGPMLNIHFTMYNRVRNFEKKGIMLKINPRLPFLYSFNSEYELVNKYLLPDFSPGYILYDSERMATTSYQHRSNIYHIRKVDESWLLIQIMHRHDAVPKDGYEESHSYYAFNVDDEKLYRIGDDFAETEEEGRAIFLTGHGIIINKQGSLQWVEI